MSSIQELSGFTRQAPSSSCPSLPKWEHSSVLTEEHLQGDLIKMEMVETEGGWGVPDSQKLLASSPGHIIISGSRLAASTSTGHSPLGSYDLEASRGERV